MPHKKKPMRARRRVKRIENVPPTPGTIGELFRGRPRAKITRNRPRTRIV